MDKKSMLFHKEILSSNCSLEGQSTGVVLRLRNTAVFIDEANVRRLLPALTEWIKEIDETYK